MLNSEPVNAYKNTLRIREIIPARTTPIIHFMTLWKNSKNRKPLILRGAHQVGKIEYPAGNVSIVNLEFCNEECMIRRLFAGPRFGVDPGVEGFFCQS